jgi:hypothetical protein
MLVERLPGAPTDCLHDLVAESEEAGSRIVRRLFEEVGRHLVAAVIAAARGHFESLRLRTANPAAAQLYEALGFRACDGVANSTHVMQLSD